MVVTSAPSRLAASVVQAFTALPFTWTTQAPHWDVSQPICVPVRRRSSRRNSESSVSPATSRATGLPFTVKFTLVIWSSLMGRPPCRPVSARCLLLRSFGPVQMLLEIVKKLRGQFSCRGVDQPAAEPCQLAADLRLGDVAELRALGHLLEAHIRAALGEAGDTALALAADGIAFRRVDVLELHRALEGRLHGADLLLDHGLHRGVRGLFELLAAGNAGAQDVDIV